MSADILDVFDQRATPQARRERPAIFAARVRWAAVRITTESDVLAGQPVREVQGVGVGDRVHVELAPTVYALGVVVAWSREEPLPGARIGHLLARVRLEADAPFGNQLNGWRAGDVVKRPRNRLWKTPTNMTVDGWIEP